jgi:hypothetical protein
MQMKMDVDLSPLPQLLIVLLFNPGVARCFAAVQSQVFYSSCAGSRAHLKKRGEDDAFQS